MFLLFLDTATSFHKRAKALHVCSHFVTENTELYMRAGAKPLQIAHLINDIPRIYF